MNTARTRPWADAVPDAALLARYAADRDEAAFAVLVRRHGPTVFGVCLRNAGHRPDAEDAFQVVFLLLARRAGELKQPERVANWLYGAAVRVARKARRAALRRRTHEAKAVPPPRPDAVSEWSDVAPLLDDELLKLSDDHRAAVLLCDVQGVSRADAAIRLGIPEGTLSSRLNAARAKLAERLARRGVALGAVALAARATAAVPDELAAELGRAVTAFHASGATPAPLADLLTGGTFPIRTKLLALFATLALGSVGMLAAWPAEEPKPAPQPEPKAKAEPPKAELPKEEPPKGEFNRPPRDKRPKLVETYQSRGTLTRPLWSPDGKTLYATARPGQGDGPIRDLTTKEFPALKLRLKAGTMPGGSLGFCDGGAVLVDFTRGDRINSVNQLTGCDLSTWLPDIGYKVKWTTELDPDDGTPLAISQDGKKVFTRPKPPAGKAAKGVRAEVRLVDAATGDPIREVVTVPADSPEPVHVAFSADASRVFLAYRADKGFALKAVDTGTGKDAWERTVAGAFLATRGFAYQLLTRAKMLAVSVAASEKDEEPATLRLFDADTGKDATALQDQGSYAASAQSFSSDGRFLAASVVDAEKSEIAPGGPFGGGKGGRPPGFGGAPISVNLISSLAIWDTTTGKRVKTWERVNDKNPQVAFAPDRPLLAILECNGAVSTAGIWDLSGLLK